MLLPQPYFFWNDFKPVDSYYSITVDWLLASGDYYESFWNNFLPLTKKLDILNYTIALYEMKLYNYTIVLYLSKK